MKQQRLTPERLFSDPPLTGSAPADLKFTPDGQALTYSAPATDDRERRDLWRLDIATGKRSLWLDARTLSGAGTDVSELTAEERAERERRRQFSHGVTSYAWHPDGRRLLIPTDGRAALVSVYEPEQPMQMLAPPETRQSGFQLSPEGNFASYVRSGDLYIWSVAEAHETRLTNEADKLVTNGLPDFLAAEEMHRFQGHWWSPTERYIAYTRVDESTVQVSYRLEMEADGARTIEQRYPYAGAQNPHVELWLYDLHEHTARCIWCPTESQVYLARVHMAAGYLLTQTQDRLQQTLTLTRHAYASAEQSTIHVERSSTWINLTDDLRVLDGDRLVFTSENSGTRKAMLIEPDGQITPLPGPTHINGIIGTTEQLVFATGWDGDAQQNHLFALSLTDEHDAAAQQLTSEEGCHEITMSRDCTRFIDRFSAPDVQVRVSVNTVDGGASTQVHEEVINAQHPYHPFMSNHCSPTFGTVAAADGQPLYYRLTPPANPSGKHATIVYVYGGPGPQKARKDWGTLLVQMFTQQGFGVLELDNRGSGNRGIDFEAPIYRQMGSVEVDDQVAGLQVLHACPWADLERVGVFGHSYGGYMTLMCLTRAPQHFRAGVAVAPVSDWHLYDSHYTERYMGLPQDNATGYSESNVLKHLPALQAPLLLMHGMADDNVLFTHSTKIMSRLQQLGKPFELMTYPGAKHSMQERDVSIHRYNMILDFFRRTLN